MHSHGYALTRGTYARSTAYSRGGGVAFNVDGLLKVTVSLGKAFHQQGVFHGK